MIAALVRRFHQIRARRRLERIVAANRESFATRLYDKNRRAQKARASR